MSSCLFALQGLKTNMLGTAAPPTGEVYIGAIKPRPISIMQRTEFLFRMIFEPTRYNLV